MFRHLYWATHLLVLWSTLGIKRQGCGFYPFKVMIFGAGVIIYQPPEFLLSLGIRLLLHRKLRKLLRTIFSFARVDREGRQMKNSKALGLCHILSKISQRRNFLDISRNPFHKALVACVRRQQACHHHLSRRE